MWQLPRWVERTLTALHLNCEGAKPMQLLSRAWKSAAVALAATAWSKQALVLAATWQIAVKHSRLHVSWV